MKLKQCQLKPTGICVREEKEKVGALYVESLRKRD